MAVAAHSLPSGSLYSPETSTYVNSLVKSAFTCATYSIGYSQAKQGKLRTADRFGGADLHACSTRPLVGLSIRRAETDQGRVVPLLTLGPTVQVPRSGALRCAQ